MNEEHYSIIKQGTEVWNNWRDNNPNTIPDLSRANLFGASLEGSFLQNTNLSNTNLVRADLRNACIRSADLRWSNLMDASLKGASIVRSDLRYSKYFISSMFKIEYYNISNKLITELINHDVEFVGKENMDKWACDLYCPLQINREFIYIENRDLYKYSKPKYRGVELLIKLFDSSGIKHSLKI